MSSSQLESDSLETSTTTEGTVEVNPAFIVSVNTLGTSTKMTVDKNGIVFEFKNVDDILSHLANSSTTAGILLEIKTAFHRIMSDNVVNAHDIPDMLVVLKKTFEAMDSFPSTPKERIEATCTILKFAIAELVLKRQIKEENAVAFAQATWALIDTCAGLIEFSLTAKPARGKWCCF